MVKSKEAAEYLKISVQTLMRWDRLGKFKAYRHPVNNYRLYKLEDLKDFAKKIGVTHQDATH